MNECNTRIALEVGEIEGKDSVNLVNGHRGDDSSIVDLDAGDPVLKRQPSPSYENLRRLRQKLQERLKSIHVSSGLLRSKAETVCFGWPRRDVPEFDEVLWKAQGSLPLTNERLQGMTRGYAQLRVKSLNGADQHVGIDCHHLYQFSRRIAPSPTPGGTRTVSKRSSIARSGSSPCRGSA